MLNKAEVHNLLLRETAERDAAAHEFEKLGLQNEANRLRDEMSPIARYL